MKCRVEPVKPERVGRSGGPMDLMLLSDRSPTPPCLARVDYTVAPLTPNLYT